MKKVLALVLAVIMVCTMAFAITVNTNGNDPYTSAPGTYSQLVPGTVLYFTVTDLAGTPGWYKDSNNNFVPENNKVGITYGKGADLVKSAGWVQVAADKTDPDSWQYQITMKDSETATYDGKAYDFSITKVTFKATGKLEQTYVFDGKGTNPAKYEMDYGLTTGELLLDDTTKPTVITGFNAKFSVGVLTTLVANTDAEGKPVTENTWVLQDAASKYGVAFKATAGTKVLRKNYTGSFMTSAWETKYGYDSTLNLAQAVNDTNLVGTATITDWSNKYNIYVVSIDGSVAKAAVTVNDGVATAKVPAYSAVVLYNGALKNVSSISGTTTGTTGTTTNPGTGANDVVGVAAALAVVALVSGAAISLKK